ncbi:MAG: MBL fold metallo-hydrolase, partial [Gaiellales bacterium]
MSDWDVQLISAGSLPMQGALLGPAGTFADTRICSNVVLLRGGGRTVLIDTAAGQLDSEWEGATSNLAEALAAHGCALTDIDTVVLTHLDFD